jgi:hypothetical protein
MTNTLVNTLNKMGGRFTTLVVNRSKGQETYCARITKASEKMVSFFDVNSKVNRRVDTDRIVFARSGQTQYRKARKTAKSSK